MDDRRTTAEEGTEHQAKEESSKKVSPEDERAQKAISDLLTTLVRIAETDFEAAFDGLVTAVNENPELVEYMAKHNGIQWVSLLYTLDKFNVPVRYAKMLKEKVGIEFDTKTMKKEIGYIEAMSMQSMVKQELHNMMMMAKLKKMFGGAGQGGPGMKVMTLDDLGDLTGLFGPGGGKKPL